jgi:hypothetical protein
MPELYGGAQRVSSSKVVQETEIKQAVTFNLYFDRHI